MGLHIPTPIIMECDEIGRGVPVGDNILLN